MSNTRESLQKMLHEYSAVPIFEGHDKNWNNKQRIKFRCSCGAEAEKAIRAITSTGAYCKACQAAHKSALISEARRLPEAETTITNAETQRKCSGCNRVKDKSEFRHAQSPGLEVPHCEECRTKTRARDARARERGKKRTVPEEKKGTHKKCTHCDRIKVIDDFTSGNNNCKACNKNSRTGNKKVKETAQLINDDDTSGVKMCVRCWQVDDEAIFTTETGHVGVVCDECRTKIDIYQSAYKHAYVELKKKMAPCADCGEGDLRVLDFDHVDRKTKIRGVSECRSVKQLEEEAAKCVLRCGICHTRRTKEQLNYRGAFGRESRKNYVDEQKMFAAGCEECGFFDPDLPEALHWDHLDDYEKMADVSSMVAQFAPFDDIDQEIAKCRLLCANCHRKRTYDQFNCTVYGAFV